MYRNHTISGAPLTIHSATKALRSEMNRFSKIFLVVDALDECTEENGCRPRFLTALDALHTVVNILFTTRSRELVLGAFRKATMLEITQCWKLLQPMKT